MAITAGEIITSARDQHPALNTGRVPSPVLWRELTRYQERLYTKIVRAVPDTLAQQTHTIALPLGTFPTSATAMDILRPIDAEAIDGAGWSTPVEILSYSDRMSRAQFPAISFLVSTVYLLGKPEWWAPWVSVKVRYMPQITASKIVADGTVLVLPADCRDACVAFLAAFMAKRLASDGSPITQPVINQLQAEAAEAETDFLDRIGAFRKAQTFRIRDVL